MQEAFEEEEEEEEEVEEDNEVDAGVQVAAEVMPSVVADVPSAAAGMGSMFKVRVWLFAYLQAECIAPFVQHLAT